MSDTKVKERSCYFCNENFELGKLQAHLQHCGSILEQCPLRCGAWIQRRHKEQHVSECPQLSGSRKHAANTIHSYARQEEPEPESNTWTPNGEALQLDSCVRYLEQEVADIRITMRKDMSELMNQKDELDNIKAILERTDEKEQHIVNNIIGLKDNLDTQLDSTANWVNQFKHDITNIQLSLEELHSTQMSLTIRLNNVVNILDQEQQERELLEKVVEEQGGKIKLIHQLDTALREVSVSIREEEELMRNKMAAIALSQNTHSIEIQQYNDTMKLQLEQTMNIQDRLLERVHILETEHPSSDRELRALAKSYLKLRDEVQLFKQTVATSSVNCESLGSFDGHFIWRIEDFNNKMKEAKDNDFIMSSPIFRTSKYGYSLKAELYLNGVGKWRGRYITSTIRVVKGPYDTLLEWPCDLQVNIVLKDQAKNRSQAMDITKSLHIRKKFLISDIDELIHASTDALNRSQETLASISATSRGDRSSTQMKRQYIFIPHTSLDKFDYIKDNVVFFEFIATQ